MKESSEYDYEVFLSFRGPNTRTDIADYLYVNMIDVGIQAYRDYEELCTREEISGPFSKQFNTQRSQYQSFLKDMLINEHYGNAVVSHLNKKRFDDETINNWKAALKEVGELKGWGLHRMLNKERVEKWDAILKELEESPL
ncbi:uncharacterized protein LOC120293749 [Eucalyptus grandis]|uniref:uncharacterized protein LOC120293749 n=1 Tax=Eucalyptus grandis TaxID=71139 RepID=UPI00192EEC3A|nr:uncharacterized protein LOC120293749 [Eucalyptus grandis]